MLSESVTPGTALSLLLYRSPLVIHMITRLTKYTVTGFHMIFNVAIFEKANVTEWFNTVFTTNIALLLLFDIKLKMAEAIPILFFTNIKIYF